jgi:hypothetical protein
MKFLLLLALLSTLLFFPAWWIQDPYEQVIATVAGKIVAPPGATLEFTDLELFFPFDLSIYLALCLASGWKPIRQRLRAIAIGTPVMVAIEVLSVALALAAMLAVMSDPRATPTRAEQVVRFATGIIRVTGLIAAAGVWFFQLGRERLSLAARAWLGA